MLACLTDRGKAFQARAAATGKARSPRVVLHDSILLKSSENVCKIEQITIKLTHTNMMSPRFE